MGAGRIGTFGEFRTASHFRKWTKIAIDVAKVALPPGVDTQEDLDRLNAMPIDEFLKF